MRFAHSGRAEQHHVLGPLQEGEAGQLLDLLARRTGRGSEVEALQRLDGREARHAGEHRPRAGASRIPLASQHLLQEPA